MKKRNKMDENILDLQKDIEKKLMEFKFQTDKIQNDFEKTIIDLQKKGYKIDKERIKEFMQKFWHTYPTKNANEWEVAIPVFIPFNIGWFDRKDNRLATKIKKARDKTRRWSRGENIRFRKYPIEKTMVRFRKTRTKEPVKILEREKVGNWT